MMTGDTGRVDGDARRRPRWPIMLAALLVMFVAGALLAGYVLSRWAPAREALLDDATATDASLPIPATTDALSSGLIDRRVREIEARLGAIDARASAAVGNADRAEGLLVAFAARRALDRGIQLGYIELLLRSRFGGSQPQAVAMIIAAGRQPVTLDELQAEFIELAPALASPPPGESWWRALRQEIAGLIVLRRAGAPSPLPEERITRARRELEAGHVVEALAEVARMERRDQATAWIARARRYAAARDALDAIETAALLDPRYANPVARGGPAR